MGKYTVAYKSGIRLDIVPWYQKATAQCPISVQPYLVRPRLVEYQSRSKFEDCQELALRTEKMHPCEDEAFALIVGSRSYRIRGGGWHSRKEGELVLITNLLLCVYA